MNSSIKKIPYILSLSRIAKSKSINLWLVGGYLRDIYLKRKKDLVDFDFCVEKNTLSLVKEFSREVKSKYIILDAVEESFRVIVKSKKKNYQFDFSKMRGASLKEDLNLRDFTINTLAVDVCDRKFKLIDMCGAKKDLDKGLIRVPSERVIKDDPLRILRGFVFSAILNFRIEKNTLFYFSRYKNNIKQVSSERIVEELYKLFSAKHSYKTIKLMDPLSILDCIIPGIKQMRGIIQGDYHHLGVWDHSIETLRQFERLYENTLVFDADIDKHLKEEVAYGRSRLQIIKFACILHDIGKPRAKKKLKKKTIFYEHEKIGRDLVSKLADKLRLSHKEKDLLKKLVFWHLRPGYLADQITPTKRAVYHFFRDTQEEGIAVIVLSLSDWRATRGPLTSFKKRRRHEKIMLALLKEYIAHQKEKPLKKIIDGNDIMKRFKIESGPVVGLILKKIHEEQSLGHITNKTQAFAISRQIIRTKGVK
jgi:poly(A) polymerase